MVLSTRKQSSNNPWPHHTLANAPHVHMLLFLVTFHHQTIGSEIFLLSTDHTSLNLCSLTRLFFWPSPSFLPCFSFRKPTASDWSGRRKKNPIWFHSVVLWRAETFESLFETKRMDGFLRRKSLLLRIVGLQQSKAVKRITRFIFSTLRGREKKPSPSLCSLYITVTAPAAKRFWFRNCATVWSGEIKVFFFFLNKRLLKLSWLNSLTVYINRYLCTLQI